MAVLRLSSSVDASAGLMWQSLISDTTRTQNARPPHVQTRFKDVCNQLEGTVRSRGMNYTSIYAAQSAQFTRLMALIHRRGGAQFIMT